MNNNPRRSISSDDPKAIPKLEEKLDKAVALQEKMKAVNLYYRKHKTLDGCAELTLEQTEKLKEAMEQSPYRNPNPFEGWQLSNNNSEIRRIRKRIENLKRYAATEYEGWVFEGGTVEPNRELNRLQIFFNEKPDADTISALNGNGFHWAPTKGAWQRLLNDNAIFAADFIKCIWPVSGEKPSELQRKARNGESA